MWSKSHLKQGGWGVRFPGSGIFLGPPYGPFTTRYLLSFVFVLAVDHRAAWRNSPGSTPASHECSWFESSTATIIYGNDHMRDLS